MLIPLVPSRFSAPQLIPEPGSPPAELAAPYEIVVCSLEGPAPALPPESLIQISPVCVVALVKFLTAAQSTTSHVSLPSVSVPTRIAPPVGGFRSFQNGATTLFGRRALGNVCTRGGTSAPVP